MFVYEKNGSICVTFQSNKPVAAPEYVIAIDEKNRDVVINGKSYTSLTATKIVETPSVSTTKKKNNTPVVEEKATVEDEKIEETVAE